MSIDELVARAVHRASLAERMLHDAGPWEMAWGPLRARAVRVVTSDTVALVADFPAACHLARPEPQLALYWRGELVGSRPIPDPGDDGFRASWAVYAAPVLA